MLFTSTAVQSTTYLLCVCLFSIAFLVFLNASVSFVISDRLGTEPPIGDYVGTLGFADELVALVACPIWGALSDRVGVRSVCVIGYAIVGLALFVIVQARDVYPQLLLARLFFSIGGAATTTMVTAILPAVTAPKATIDSEASPSIEARHATTASLSSELTITPANFGGRIDRSTATIIRSTDASPPKLAGLVGMFTGLGALIALTLFLPLPTRFSQTGASAGQAVADSYYVVGTIALLVSIACFFGLRDLHGEKDRSWKAISGKYVAGDAKKNVPYVRLLLQASSLGMQDLNIGLGYLGGAVARASSVGITLFIPLYVNSYFIQSGLCSGDPRDGSEDMKRECRRAYVLAAQLTGTSQLAALIFAPIFGYLADKYRRRNLPLLVGALSGVFAYMAFAVLPSPEPTRASGGSPAVFVIVAFIGLSQISAIVCSLGMLGRGVLGEHPSPLPSRESSNGSAEIARDESETHANEDASLLPKPATTPRDSLDRSQLKGSIAGIYSLGGGAGILVLTKLGGLLFDSLSPSAPFYMLAIFNGILLSVGIAAGIIQEYRERQRL